MVARLIGLRFALLLSPLRKGFPGVLGAVALRLGYLALFGAFAVAPTIITRQDPGQLPPTDVLFGAGLLLLVTLVPLCVPQTTLDVRLFVGFPVKPAQLTLMLMATSWVSWTGLGMLVWVSTFLVTRAQLSTWGIGELLGIALVLCGVAVFSRTAGALGDLLAGSERRALVRRMLGVLIIVSAVPLISLFIISTAGTEGAGQLRETAQSLAWTPLGAPFAALTNAGPDIQATIVQVGMQIAMLSVVTGAAISLTTAHFGRVDRPVSSEATSTGLGWFAYLSGSPTLSIGARSLTYWMRDPRYIVALVAIPVIPLLVVLVLFVAGVDHQVLTMLPLPIVLVMIGWMVHNDVATDSTALWMHVASGVTGWQDRAGRVVPVFALGVPVLVIGSSITVVLLGDWEAYPAVLALALVSLCASAATSSVTSVVRPYPTSRPGESPFVQPAWQGAGAGLAQTGALLGAALLASPVMVVVFGATDMGVLTGAGMLAATVLYSALLVLAGLWVGGRVYQRRNSELLAFTQVYD